MSKELLAAIKAAKLAGKISMKYFRKNISFEKKPDASPVTIADKLCEKAIIKTIKSSFPEHAFLGEEGGSQGKNDFTWIIDPIDGTRDFIRGIGDFGVSIALQKNNKIILGVMFLPVSKELFSAELGKGAFLNGKRIGVSKKASLSESWVYFQVNKPSIFDEKFSSGFISFARKVDSFRSAGGLETLCDVACGRADAYITAKASIWDIAAGKVIVEEAGGTVTNLAGKDSLTSGNCLASNGKLHEEIIRELS